MRQLGSCDRPLMEELFNSLIAGLALEKLIGPGSWLDAGSNDVAKLHISHMQTSGNMLELIQMLSALHRSKRWANANG